MPVFTDSESNYEIVPEGDYILCVFEFTTDISSGQKTAGAERFNIVFTVEGTNSKVRETLIDSEKTLWKIDQFIKAAGIRSLQKGDAFHFEQDRAEQLNVPWINPMGLRVHARVVEETYTSRRSGKPVVKNAVALYYTDREPLKPDPELRNKPTSKPKSEEQGNSSPWDSERKTPF